MGSTTPDIIEVFSHQPPNKRGPQFDSREAKVKRSDMKSRGPDAIVLHAAGEYIDVGPCPAHFTEYQRSVIEGCHSVVTPSGVIIRTGDPYTVQWHCRAHGMNWRSLGLELLVPGVHNYVTFLERLEDPRWLSRVASESALWEVTRWCKMYDISPGRIYTHQELDPRRKKDPGVAVDIVGFREIIGRSLSR